MDAKINQRDSGPKWTGLEPKKKEENHKYIRIHISSSLKINVPRKCLITHAICK